MVYLTGAGPGDPDLLTVRARKILQTADVVIYDRLADERILRCLPKDAEKIYVGKSAGQHTLKQDEINNLLVEKSLAGKVVVRLKGGDPFVFGRGGEEALHLRENGIDFEIIPGVTSAIAVPAYAGIPVTHRGLATSFAVITGHEDPTKNFSSIRWEKISTAADTLIFLMGMENLPKIVGKLIEFGRDRKTPAAVIRNGTKFSQEVLITTLENAPADVEKNNIRPPAIFIVGEVVNLRQSLAWFDKKILFGKKILVTRTRTQASKLSRLLENFGAEVLEFPTIKISPPSDNFQSLDAAIQNLPTFDRIIFTSANGVEKFFERLRIFKLDSRALGKAKIAVIGSATAEKLSDFGIFADVIPKKFVAESLVDELKNFVDGEKILLARAEVARDVLPAELEKFGAKVTLAKVYRTDPAAENSAELKSKIDSGEIDLATFTSSSTVENFVQAVGVDSLKKISAAAIGPITADTLRKFGVNPVCTAEKYTIDGLAESIKKIFADNSQKEVF